MPAFQEVVPAADCKEIAFRSAKIDKLDANIYSPPSKRLKVVVVVPAAETSISCGAQYVRAAPICAKAISPLTRTVTVVVPAALARLAGVTNQDRIWDPFVGGGTELIECGILAPKAQLFGSDIDKTALSSASQNFIASGLQHYRLFQSDVRLPPFRKGMNLVISNPPLGRRTLPRKDLSGLLRQTLDSIAIVLVPGGRLFWVSPFFDTTIQHGETLGLKHVYRQRIDMGGFASEIQGFIKSERNA